jgi:hypothetical protein
MPLWHCFSRCGAFTFTLLSPFVALASASLLHCLRILPTFALLSRPRLSNPLGSQLSLSHCFICCGAFTLLSLFASLLHRFCIAFAFFLLSHCSRIHLARGCRFRIALFVAVLSPSHCFRFSRRFCIAFVLLSPTFTMLSRRTISNSLGS